jgi:flagellar biosynthesis protein FlhG
MHSANPTDIDSKRTQTAAPSAPHPCIWAVGGGKGGVGKSVITTNIALSLALRGRRCAVVDADLGCANLHTLLGVPSPPRTLSDFVSRRVESLHEVMCPTSEPNLWLVSGARALLGMANPKHAQKQRLLRHLQNLEVDDVLLDLSAGTGCNVLDFFLAAHQPILVVVPEPTAIDNAYQFLKAAFFRYLASATKNKSVRAAIERVLEPCDERGPRSPRELIAGVAALDPLSGQVLEERALAFCPWILVNQVSTREQRNVGEQMREACRSQLGAEVRVLGALEHDESVPIAVRAQKPVMQIFPTSEFALELDGLAVKLVDPLRPKLAGKVAKSPVAAHRTGRAAQASCEPAGNLTAGLDRAVAPTRRGRANRSANGARKAASVVARAPDLSKPGAYLRHCREQLALGLPELYARTRIRSLSSIENERFEDLPSEFYVRGFVLQYAQALGIQEAEAITSSFLERYRQARARA